MYESYVHGIIISFTRKWIPATVHEISVNKRRSTHASLERGIRANERQQSLNWLNVSKTKLGGIEDNHWSRKATLKKQWWKEEKINNEKSHQTIQNCMKLEATTLHHALATITVPDQVGLAGFFLRLFEDCESWPERRCWRSVTTLH